MNFSMTIRERKPARAVVKRSREVSPLGRINAIDEERIIV
jgi:hypothetical protein